MNVWSVKYCDTKFYIEEEEEEEEEEALDSEIINYGLSKAHDLHEGLG